MLKDIKHLTIKISDFSKRSSKDHGVGWWLLFELNIVKS